MTIVERDPHTGQIKKKILSSEEAREMQKKRYSKPKGESMEKLARLAGFADPDEMPEHLRLFADQFVTGSARSVSAGIQFMKVSGIIKDDTHIEMVAPEEGKLCPLCHEIKPVTGWSDEETGQEKMRQLLDHLKAEHSIDQGYSISGVRGEPG